MTCSAVAFEASHTLEAVPDGEILLVVGSFADECVVAPLLLSRKWRFTAFVGAGVERRTHKTCTMGGTDFTQV
jgi:hypothetical protein